MDFEGDTGLIVPMPEIDPTVDDLRRVHDSSRRAGVLAHVTVLYPFVERGALDESIGQALAALAASVRRFSVTFRSIATFPGVVWLRPEPATPFSTLTARVAARWPKYPPYGGRHGEPTPHLTVGEVSGAEADEVTASVAPRLPVSGVAESLEVIELVDGRWSTRWSFPLDR